MKKRIITKFTKENKKENKKQDTNIRRGICIVVTLIISTAFSAVSNADYNFSSCPSILILATFGLLVAVIFYRKYNRIESNRAIRFRLGILILANLATCVVAFIGTVPNFKLGQFIMSFNILGITELSVKEELLQEEKTTDKFNICLEVLMYLMIWGTSLTKVICSDEVVSFIMETIFLLCVYCKFKIFSLGKASKTLLKVAVNFTGYTLLSIISAIRIISAIPGDTEKRTIHLSIVLVLVFVIASILVIDKLFKMRGLSIRNIVIRGNNWVIAVSLCVLAAVVAFIISEISMSVATTNIDCVELILNTFNISEPVKDVLKQSLIALIGIIVFIFIYFSVLICTVDSGFIDNSEAKETGITNGEYFEKIMSIIGLFIWLICVILISDKNIRDMLLLMSNTVIYITLGVRFYIKNNSQSKDIHWTLGLLQLLPILIITMTYILSIFAPAFIASGNGGIFINTGITGILYTSCIIQILPAFSDLFEIKVNKLYRNSI